MAADSLVGAKGRGSVSHARHSIGGELPRAERTAEIDRARGGPLQQRIDRRLDDARRGRKGGVIVAPAQPVDQHGGGQDKRGRVGLVAARNVRRRSVLRLRHAVALAEVDRRGETEAPRQLRRFIGQDVAEHVRRRDDVEARGVADEQCGHRVHQLFVVGDARVHLRGRAHLAQEQPFGDAEHVGFVHGGDVPAPRGGQLERGVRDARRGEGGDLPDREREIRRRHQLAAAAMHVAVGVEAFGVLANDDEIHRRAAPVRQPVARAARAHVGKEIELDAQLRGRVDAALGARRVSGGRHGSEDDAVRPAAGVEHGGGQRRSGRLQRGQSDLSHVEGEVERQRLLHALEHPQRRVGDVGADAVARQHNEVHAITRTGAPARNARTPSTASPYARR